MTGPCKICVVTGSRADYGHLRPVIAALKASEDFECQLMVIGSHWSPRHGVSAQAITDDGYEIKAKVEVFVDGDSALSVLQVMGETLTRIGQEFTKLQPDLVLMLGDRTEIFIAATACHMMGIPIAHLAGGDVTSGAIDDALRHSITKMASLHFVTNEDAHKRVLQLGEQDNRVFWVGSTAIQTVLAAPTLTESELLPTVGLLGERPYLLVTYHPETLSSNETQSDVDELFIALGSLVDTYDIVLTAPNEDTDFEVISKRSSDFLRENPGRAVIVKSAGTTLYSNLLRYARVCVGNSSSGLYEAPSLGTPTVNIGNRQQGRPRSGSVFDCRPVAKEITDSVLAATQVDKTSFSNPYERGDAASEIVSILLSLPEFYCLPRKRFVDR